MSDDDLKKIIQDAVKTIQLRFLELERKIDTTGLRLSAIESRLTDIECELRKYESLNLPLLRKKVDRWEDEKSEQCQQPKVKEWDIPGYG